MKQFRRWLFVLAGWILLQETLVFCSLNILFGRHVSVFCLENFWSEILRPDHDDYLIIANSAYHFWQSLQAPW